MERLRADDRGAFETLYDAYGRVAYGLAYRIVGDAGEAEDAVQEGFLAFWRQSRQLDAVRGSVRSLLLTMVHRRAVDAVRRRPKRPELGLEQAGTLPSNAPDPVEEASAREDRQAIARALGELPAEQRQAVELTYFGGLTVAELAERAAIPLGTAKSRLRLALDRLRKSLPAARPT